MPETAYDRLVGAYRAVYDLVPQALAVRLADPEAIPDVWRRGPHRLVFAPPECVDHWEAAAMGDPWLHVDSVRKGVRLGLRVEGSRGLRRLRGLLAPPSAERRTAFFDAAGRFDEKAESALVVTAPDKSGDWKDTVVGDLTTATNSLVPSVLEGLLDHAAKLPAWRDDPSPAAPRPALVLCALTLEQDDRVGLRREMKRFLALWAPAWGLPDPDATPAAKADLDRRLAAAYRSSLRLVGGHLGPPERAVLRVEARALAAAYRSAGLQRPRLLDVLADRLTLR